MKNIFLILISLLFLQYNTSVAQHFDSTVSCIEGKWIWYKTEKQSTQFLVTTSETPYAKQLTITVDTIDTGGYQVTFFSFKNDTLIDSVMTFSSNQKNPQIFLAINGIGAENLSGNHEFILFPDNRDTLRIYSENYLDGYTHYYLRKDVSLNSGPQTNFKNTPALNTYHPQRYYTLSGRKIDNFKSNLSISPFILCNSKQNKIFIRLFNNTPPLIQ